MNVFLIHPDPIQSARLFANSDPTRARKQLLECCQILASVEHRHFHTTWMVKADRTRYGHAHPHHPLVVHAATFVEQYRLTSEVGRALAREFPDHACSRSLEAWSRFAPVPALASGPLLVVRRGMPNTTVATREEYADLLLRYLQLTKHFPLLDQE